MSGFNRNQFGGTELSNLKDQDEAFKEKASFGDDRVGFLSLSEGSNVVRVYPAHPNAKTFMQPEMKHWLQIEVEYTDKSGKLIKEIKPKGVFSAKIHSKLGKCPIDRYIHHLVRVASDEYQSKEERAAFLAPMKSHKGGITGKTKWIVYADLGGKFGRLSLPTAVKKSMNEIAIGQDVGNGVITTDPFTHPDTGSCVIVKYNKQTGVDQKDRKAEDYYKTAIQLSGPTSLSDDQLGVLVEQKSLEEIYKDSYTRKDYDLAIEGLQNFDAKNNYGIFEIDEYVTELEEIYEGLPEPAEDDDAPAKAAPVKKAAAKKAPAAKAAPVEEETPEEFVDEMPWEKAIAEMDMSELQSLITKNSLPCRLTKRTTLEDAREWVQEEMDLLTAESEAKEPVEEVAPARSGRGSRKGISDLQKELEE